MSLDKRCGLTFVELMLATSIFAVVAVAIYVTFGTGISTWRRAQQAQQLYQDLRFALDKIAQDLSNAAVYLPTENFTNFQGENNEVSFYSLVETFRPAPQYQRLYKITYQLDEQARILLRLAQAYPESDSEIQPAQPEVAPEKIARQISKLNFYYCYADNTAEPNSYKWLDNWNAAQDIPLGVKIELELVDSPLVVSKYVFIPTGKEGQEQQNNQ